MKKKYNNAEHAKMRIADLEKELETILAEELVGVNKVEQTLGVWLEIFGDNEAKKDLMERLREIEDELINAHLYLRHLVTKYEMESNVRLLDTFH
ncbi:MAG: hypothetical protein NE327_14670 [Lentisphaeraceae bacterium]|nr:hypothetical protein [Lentisphaeraceae bacterium]